MIITKIWAQSWPKLTKNWVLGFLLGIGYITLVALLWVAVFYLRDSSTLSESASPTWNSLFLPILLAFYAFSTLFMVYGLQAWETQRVSFRSLLSKPFSAYLRATLAQAIVMLIPSLLFFPLFVVGFSYFLTFIVLGGPVGGLLMANLFLALLSGWGGLFLLFFLFVPYMHIDLNLPFWAGIRKGTALTLQHFPTILLYLILTIVLNTLLISVSSIGLLWAGWEVCRALGISPAYILPVSFIGIFFTAPFMHIATAGLYLHFQRPTREKG